MSRILTFGEPLIIHYLPEPILTSESNSFLSLGGSEINTSISLANNNNQVYLLSSLPNNKLGQEFLEILEHRNIETQYIHLSKEHQLIGSMYVKNKGVIYQRQYSCFSFFNVMNIDLDNIFENNFNWCHLTGITPLLSVSVSLLWKELLNNCFIYQIPVSIDLNYRTALGEFHELWRIVKPIVFRLELFIISIPDILLISKMEHLEMSTLNLEQQLLLLADRLSINKLVTCQKQLLEDGTQNRCSYLVYKQKIYKSKIKNHSPVEHIGGGDSFVGSLINSFLRNSLNNNLHEQITNILDKADYYTIDNQDKRGNFPKF